MSYNAFTTKYKIGLSNKLISKEVVINYMGNTSRSLIALWDTGATRTCVSEELAKELNLISTGKQIINTPSGSSVQNTYLIDLFLPNSVAINKIMILDAKIGNQKIDMLIGMDIINHGNFAVSNYNGKTYFTYGKLLIDKEKLY